jgi:protein involved in polysaccharide export with SLBB domain
MKSVVFSILAAGFIAAAPCWAQTAPTNGIRPGDVIRVAVWREPQLSGEFGIAEDGSITHPIYRELKVSGKTIGEIEQQLRTLLSRLTSAPQFVVEPLVRVGVGGEVRTPNLYTVPPVMTIAEVVALAGGATDRGRLESVRLIRDGHETVIDLKTPGTSMATSTVRSGDQIFVDRRVSIFRDYIAPAGSIFAALAAIANIFVN